MKLTLEERRLRRLAWHKHDASVLAREAVLCMRAVTDDPEAAAELWAVALRVQELGPRPSRARPRDARRCDHRLTPDGPQPKTARRTASPTRARAPGR